MRKGTCLPVTLNTQNIPQAEVVKYLGIHLVKHGKNIFGKKENNWKLVQQNVLVNG